MKLDPTPSQTVGPYHHYALPYEGGGLLVKSDDPDAVRLIGAIVDGDGQPVSDALVEIWQANRAGRYAHPEDRREDLPLDEDFTGFGRVPADVDGRYEFLTVKPGLVPGPDGRTPQAPHIQVTVFARGLLRQLVTRVYFPDEEANDADPLLSSIEDPAARSTLIARQIDGAYGFDIHLQGDRQTVFLDV